MVESEHPFPNDYLPGLLTDGSPTDPHTHGMDSIA